MELLVVSDKIRSNGEGTKLNRAKGRPDEKGSWMDKEAEKVFDYFYFIPSPHSREVLPLQHRPLALLFPCIRVYLLSRWESADDHKLVI